MHDLVVDADTGEPGKAIGVAGRRTDAETGHRRGGDGVERERAHADRNGRLHFLENHGHGAADVAHAAQIVWRFNRHDRILSNAGAGASQRMLNSISRLTSTGTGSPPRMPGRNRQRRAAAIACSSRPNGGANARTTRTSPHSPFGSTTHSTVMIPCARARIASDVYAGDARVIGTGEVTPLPGRTAPPPNAPSRPRPAPAPTPSPDPPPFPLPGAGAAAIAVPGIAALASGAGTAG